MNMKEIIIGIVVLCAALVGIFAAGNALNHTQCRNNVQEMGKEYRYDLINGCRIGLDDGTFIYWKMYRDFN